MYLVMEIRKTLAFEQDDILGIPVNFGQTPLSWADGMVGAAPIFETREAAEEYADGRQIVEIKEKTQ